MSSLASEGEILKDNATGNNKVMPAWQIRDYNHAFCMPLTSNLGLERLLFRLSGGGGGSGNEKEMAKIMIPMLDCN